MLTDVHEASNEIHSRLAEDRSVVTISTSTRLPAPPVEVDLTLSASPWPFYSI
jgi:hypothetical protein